MSSRPPEAEEAPPRSRMFRAAAWLWDRGLTPHMIVRSLGPYGPALVQRYVDNRFRDGEPLGEEERRLFGAYAYHPLALPACAEYCLNQLLAPIGWPRKPLAPVAEALEGVPVTWLYGERDWMSPAYGQACATRMRASGKIADCITLPSAGHYVFLDRPTECNNLILQICARAFKLPHLDGAAASKYAGA
eukprot:gnl/TRDRNA2_/TRDRNA2_90403_c0_seq1.p1 gnl/TRDRNA2_/TRDRNA2_90403_c0~~gnl/TRDRNA2_/TRDRNA2_90403_c0_seq1.p1  ORF type:complete len:190 (+),score=16.54 gnl/TRDRNA2_/TRDRNA2_90403_c0_seq1:135-704(+)